MNQRTSWKAPVGWLKYTTFINAHVLDDMNSFVDEFDDKFYVLWMNLMINFMFCGWVWWKIVCFVDEFDDTLNVLWITYSFDSDSLTSLMLFTFELVPSHLVFIVISVETSSNSSTFWEKHFVKPVNIRVTHGWRLEIIFHTVGFQMNTRKMKKPRSMFKTPTTLRNIWK